jgi:putative transposase
VLKGMKYRIYPNKVQIELIEKHFGSTRFIYNYFLEYRKKEYEKGNKKVNYITTQAELTILKKLEQYKWLKEFGSQSLQMSLRNLDSAFTKF